MSKGLRVLPAAILDRGIAIHSIESIEGPVLLTSRFCELPATAMRRQVNVEAVGLHRLRTPQLSGT
jgi:hypothetical protein